MTPREAIHLLGKRARAASPTDDSLQAYDLVLSTLERYETALARLAAGEPEAKLIADAALEGKVT